MDVTVKGIKPISIELEQHARPMNVLQADKTEELKNNDDDPFQLNAELNVKTNVSINYKDDKHHLNNYWDDLQNKWKRLLGQVNYKITNFVY